MAVVLFCLHFLKKNNIVSNTFAMIIAFLQAILIIGSHSHYTIDVLIAFIIVPYIIGGKYWI